MRKVLLTRLVFEKITLKIEATVSQSNNFNFGVYFEKATSGESFKHKQNCSLYNCLFGTNCYFH